MILSNKVIFVDRLDTPSLIFLLWKRLLYKEVGFRDAKPCYRGQKTRKVLAVLGIKWFESSENDVSAWTGAYHLNAVLTKQVVNKLSKISQSYLCLLGLLGNNQRDKEKIEASMQREMLGDWLVGGTSSLSLIDYLFKDKNMKVMYYPANLSHSLLRHGCVSWIRVSSFLASTNQLADFMGFSYLALKTIFRGIFRKPVKADVTPEEINPADCQVAYFPHKGFRYGKNIFKKTFIFDSDKNSALFRSKVLVFGFNAFDRLSARFMRWNKIPSAIIQSRPGLKDLLNLPSPFIKACLKDCLFGKVAPMLLSAQFYLRTLSFQKQLNQYPHLRVAYFFYDILVPNSLLFALALKGELITADKVKFARPGSGVKTGEFGYIDQRKAKETIPAETVLQWDMVES